LRGITLYLLVQNYVKMSKKTSNLTDILPDEHNKVIIEATEKMIADLEHKLEKARQTLDYLKSGGKTPEVDKPKFKWNKVVLEVLSILGVLSESQRIYEKAIELHKDQFYPAYDRRTVIARLSSSISQLKNGDTLTFHENSIGVKIYGLKDWYDKKGRVYEKNVGKYEDEIDKFDLQISDDIEDGLPF